MNTENTIRKRFTQGKSVIDLLVVTIMVLSMVVAVLAPYNLIRGDADTWWEYLAGVVGLSFWALAMWSFTAYLPS